MKVDKQTFKECLHGALIGMGPGCALAVFLVAPIILLGAVSQAGTVSGVSPVAQDLENSECPKMLNLCNQPLRVREHLGGLRIPRTGEREHINGGSLSGA
jgi:hypothetical protein